MRRLLVWRWKLIFAVSLFIFVICAAHIRIVYIKRVIGLRSGGQAVIMFRQHGYLCLGYYLDWDRGGPCNLSVATNGDEILLQKTKYGAARVTSIELRAHR